MSQFSITSSLPEFALRKGFITKRKPLSFYVELTVRCNNNCSHCYINLPAGDTEAKKNELTFEGFKPIIDDAVAMGALWCNVTGGEPLLRNDFEDIYLYLKKKGLMVSVFTNATLITENHARLFKKYPPRDLEVTVYGVTERTYETVTRKPGSFHSFMNGIECLRKHNVPVRLKAMALRSNYKELGKIADFCRSHTKDYFRFDPFLHLRFDRDEKRNKAIVSERLTSEEIVFTEQNDRQRFQTLKNNCDIMIMPEEETHTCDHLFKCGAGNKEFYLTHDGMFRLCSALCHAQCVYDLKKGNLTEAWEQFVPKIRALRSNNKKYLQMCGKCPIINLCMWCPAHANLETGLLDEFVGYFCDTAHQRKEMLLSNKSL